MFLLDVGASFNDNEVLLFSWNSIQFFRIKPQNKFANIWRIERVRLELVRQSLKQIEFTFYKVTFS